MIALLLSLCTASSFNEVMVTKVSTAKLRLEVRFSDSNRKEQIPITRFVIAEQKPAFEYKITKFDSIVSRTVQDLNNSKPVELAAPIQLGGARLYPVVVYPSYLNKDLVNHYESVEIELQIAPSSKELKLSSSLRKVFSNLILNFEENGYASPSGYLIIALDAFIDELTPLAAWKEKKGMN